MVNQEKILEDLKSYSDKIQSCIVKAVQHFQEKLADESAIITQSTKANYIRDFIVENAKKLFWNDPNVSIHRKRGMIVFRFNTSPHLFLKFKKFNKYNRVAYSRTAQALAFTSQDELFPEYSNAINLHAGYKWDEMNTKIECLIGLPDGNGRHQWIAYLGNTPNQTVIENIDTALPEPKVKVKIKQIETAYEKIG